ncbi:hypothetical protein K0T92_18465, partial [Paenibacillus oenotherae]
MFRRRHIGNIPAMKHEFEGKSQKFCKEPQAPNTEGNFTKRRGSCTVDSNDTPTERKPLAYNRI